MPLATKLRIGRNLRAIRQRAGMSQETFAQKLGFSLRYYGDVERGQENLSLDSLDQLAKMLDIDPVELFASDPDGPTRAALEHCGDRFATSCRPD